MQIHDTKLLISCFDRVDDIVEKEKKKAILHHFLLFHNCFRSCPLLGYEHLRLCGTKQQKILKLILDKKDNLRKWRIVELKQYKKGGSAIGMCIKEIIKHCNSENQYSRAELGPY